MKIVVVGPGAMGCLFAAHLARANFDTWVLDKDSERAEIIRRQGILVEGLNGEWRQPAKITTLPSEIGDADLVMITAKSYNTKEAAAFARPMITEKTLVLTLQNGLGNIEIISEAVGAEKVIGGITNLGVTLLGTGKIRFAGKGETVIGRIDAKLPVELRALREAFNRAGFPTRLSRDIKGFLWSKLVINAAINPLAAVTRLANGRLIEFAGTRRILRDAALEAVKIAKRKRIRLIYDDPLAKVEAVCEATAENISSMLQDVLRRRRTEIDFINGVIVRLGQEFGIPVPVNTVLVDLVKTIESSYALIKDEKVL